MSDIYLSIVELKTSWTKRNFLLKSWLNEKTNWQFHGQFCNLHSKMKRTKKYHHAFFLLFWTTGLHEFEYIKLMLKGWFSAITLTKKICFLHLGPLLGGASHFVGLSSTTHRSNLPQAKFWCCALHFGLRGQLSECRKLQSNSLQIKKEILDV